MAERYRIYSDGAVYYLTMTVVEWLPVFIAEAPCKIWTQSLNYSHERKGLRINAYVIMPTHVHAIVFGRDFQPEALRAALTDLRKFTGRQLADYCGSHMPRCFQNVLFESAGDDRSRRFWQPTMHAEQIETERFWEEKRDYIHDNPCRKGLVNRAEHWRFSSAAYWLSEGQIANDVVLSPLDWG
jgi:REP element-mobilizing transposase RayT